MRGIRCMTIADCLWGALVVATSVTFCTRWAEAKDPPRTDRGELAERTDRRPHHARQHHRAVADVWRGDRRRGLIVGSRTG